MAASSSFRTPPPSYRVITLFADGNVADMRSLSAGDDDEALAQAKTMVDRHAVELWDGLRFIEHYSGRRTAT